MNLFNLDCTIYLYDITSTYFKGRCVKNDEAKHGYSRDKRPDCKQVLVGLVVDREGFPIMHEVFEGNRADSTTVGAMLDALEERQGKKEMITVVVDRGMASQDDLDLIKSRGYHYVVATRQGERDRFLCEFEDEEGFVEVVRPTSATKPHQKKSHVEVKKKECGGKVYVLVVSEERTVKDRSIREAHERRLLCDLKKLKERITCGRLVREDKVYEAIGRIKERYPRVAKYYEISYDEGKLTFTARKALKTHQVVTIVLPTADGRVLKVRRATRPTSEQIELYSKLNVPHEPIKPKKIWL